MDLVISATDRELTVRVRGDVDAASADHLSAALAGAEDVRHLVVDLSASSFVDIAGMRAIAECATRRNRRGHGLVVASPPPSAETILRMMPRPPHVRCEPREPSERVSESLD